MAGDIAYEIPGSGEARGVAEGRVGTALARIKEAINGGLNNENLSGLAEITDANLESEQRGLSAAPRRRRLVRRLNLGAKPELFRRRRNRWRTGEP
jgi:hypothetical protein